MLALVLSLGVPAVAQAIPFDNRNNGFDHNGFNNFNGINGGDLSQGIGNESESGNVTENFSVTSSGDNSNQCVTPLQFGNTGNLENGQSFLQDHSLSGNLQAEGPTFDFAPVLNGGCTQDVQQSSAASSQY
jgi:hypothetical protein